MTPAIKANVTPRNKSGFKLGTGLLPARWVKALIYSGLWSTYKPLPCPLYSPFLLYKKTVQGHNGEKHIHEKEGKASTHSRSVSPDTLWEV